MTGNILYCEKLKTEPDTRSVFGRISHLAGQRIPKNPFHQDDDDDDDDKEKTTLPINVLSLLKRYPATHLSVVQLLKIITVNHKTLHSLVINEIHNYKEFYCKLLYSWFLPSCSDDKPITL